MTIRIVIADDQVMVRAGFRLLLDTEPDIEVVGDDDPDGHELATPSVLQRKARTHREPSTLSRAGAERSAVQYVTRGPPDQAIAGVVGLSRSRPVVEHLRARTAAVPTLTVTVAMRASACLRMLVSASCTIR